MKGKALLAALSLALCLSAGAAAQGQQAGLAQSAVMSESFDQPSPPGWELLPGAQVQAVEGGSALVCGNGGHGVWVAAQARDLTLRFRYRPGQGAGRVAVSASGEPPNAQEYSIVLAPGEIGIDRVTSGQIQNLAGGAIMLQPGSWYDMTVQVESGRISVSVGGQTVVTAVDRQPLPTGTIALGAIEGSGFAFDNVTLMAGPAMHPAAMVQQQVPAPEAPSGAQPGRLQTVAPMPAAPTPAMPSPSMPPGGKMLAGTAVPPGANIYLNLFPITNAKAKDYQNWISVDRFEFSMDASVYGQGAGAASFKPFRITKPVDASSPAIYLHCAEGSFVSSAVVEVVNATGFIHMRITLWNLRIVGVNTVGDMQDRLSETINMSFTKAQWEVMSNSGTVKSGWDSQLNKKL